MEQEKIQKIIIEAKEKGKKDVVTIAEHMLENRTECLKYLAKKFANEFDKEEMVEKIAKETVEKTDNKIGGLLKEKAKKVIAEIKEQALLPVSMITQRGEYLPEKDLIVVTVFSPIKPNFMLMQAGRWKLQNNLGLIFKITIEKDGNNTLFKFKPLV